ncbi:MAG TPA: asparagine synthase-related protein [Acidimicrobiia bacterium]|nr:asparagine synthase-related protein [Acidimicrobiia bacterium]
MGSVVGLITKDQGEATEALDAALTRSPHRGATIERLRVGRVDLGVTAHRGEAQLWAGDPWSVAVSGVVDSVAGVDVADSPAGAIASHLARAGISGLADVLGDFVVVATDGQRLLAARDHLGTDGLFTGASGSVGVVASEPKQVSAALGRSRRPDIEGLVAVYFSQWEAADDVPSVVRGVARVPRAGIVEVTPAGWQRRGRVWDPSRLVESSNLTVAEAKEAVWELTKVVVGSTLTERSAVGLSGGIDSTLIATAAAAVEGPGVRALSALYPHAPSVDESEYIAATVELLQMESTTYQPSRPRLADLEIWVDIVDGPNHGLSLGAISEMNDVAAAAGVDNLLGGEMAELVYDLREHSLSRMLWRGRFGELAGQLRAWRAKGAGWPSMGRSLASGLAPPRLGLAYMRRFRPMPDPAVWLDRSYMTGMERHWDLERPARRRWPEIQLFFATGPSYPGLEIATVMGDAAGVRTRRPLVDRRLWELFLTFPPEVKFPDFITKSLVRHVLDGRAPDEVVWRRDKTVFDEDARVRTETATLLARIQDGFHLPGVRYPELIQRLQDGEMSTWEMSMVRTLASIHAFVEVCS